MDRPCRTTDEHASRAARAHLRKPQAKRSELGLALRRFHNRARDAHGHGTVLEARGASLARQRRRDRLPDRTKHSRWPVHPARNGRRGCHEHHRYDRNHRRTNLPLPSDRARLREQQPGARPKSGPADVTTPPGPKNGVDTITLTRSQSDPFLFETDLMLFAPRWGRPGLEPHQCRRRHERRRPQPWHDSTYRLERCLAIRESIRDRLHGWFHGYARPSELVPKVRRDHRYGYLDGPSRLRLKRPPA